MVKNQYSAWVGIKKSIKNVLIVAGVPALLLFLENFVKVMPDEWNPIAAPIIGLIAYFIKNYVQNR